MAIRYHSASCTAAQKMAFLVFQYFYYVMINKIHFYVMHFTNKNIFLSIKRTEREKITKKNIGRRFHDEEEQFFRVCFVFLFSRSVFFWISLFYELILVFLIVIWLVDDYTDGCRRRRRCVPLQFIPNSIYLYIGYSFFVCAVILDCNTSRHNKNGLHRPNTRASAHNLITEKNVDKRRRKISPSVIRTTDIKCQTGRNTYKFIGNAVQTRMCIVHRSNIPFECMVS